MADEVQKEDMHGGGASPEEEALRLKNLAEVRFNSGDLKSALKYANRAQKLHPSLGGVAEMVTALSILCVAAESAFPVGGSGGSPTPDYYKMLGVERFSDVNTIRKEFRRLALILHPDKSTFVASVEAFKLVSKAVDVFSDRVRREEFDRRLRFVMQSEAEAGVSGPKEVFWTACTACRLLHQFERKYLGQNLMCPSCNKSFKAVEVDQNSDNERESEEGKEERVKNVAPTRFSSRVRERTEKYGAVGTSKNVESEGKRKMSSFGDAAEKTDARVASNVADNGGFGKGLRSKRGEKSRKLGERDPGNEGLAQGVEKSGSGAGEVKSGSGVGEEKGLGSEVAETEKARGEEVLEEETMTLAQMQTVLKKRMVKGNLNATLDEGKSEKFELKERLEENEEEIKAIMNLLQKRERDEGSGNKNVRVYTRRNSKSHKNLEIEKTSAMESDLEILPVDDSDFYDFDKDRKEKNFKQGQVWSIYDDNDGMPRHYALIDEVYSFNPFELLLSWLEFQSNGDDTVISQKEMGLQISCGRFKVAKKTSVKYLKLFSHIVDCERAAREVYRIYPKKGSVWAIYNKGDLETGRNEQVQNVRCHDIVVFLTTFNEMQGSSIAYLEKVNGFKTVFKRREIGVHAIKWLEKDDVKLLSHQIPATKLSGEEIPGLPKDCWELDPAALPPQLLVADGKK